MCVLRELLQTIWGISSVGRASALHAEGQEFESPILHHFEKRALNGSFLVRLIVYCFIIFDNFDIIL